MNWIVEISTVALKHLQDITDKRVRNNLFERIEELSVDPERQGKPLRDELVGLRCVRAIGQRYRIIYTVEPDRVIVLVVAVGIRKEGDRSDIYQIAARLWREGLIDIQSEGPPEGPNVTGGKLSRPRNSDGTWRKKRSDDGEKRTK